jgi:hypothetical protein
MRLPGPFLLLNFTRGQRDSRVASIKFLGDVKVAIFRDPQGHASRGRAERPTCWMGYRRAGTSAVELGTLSHREGAAKQSTMAEWFIASEPGDRIAGGMMQSLRYGPAVTVRAVSSAAGEGTMATGQHRRAPRRR